MSGITHDFTERLEWSANLSNEPAWISFYRRLWPEALQIIRIDANSRWQRWGVDRMILLPSGRQIFIDEKKREARDKDGRPFLDVLLEEWSVGQIVDGEFLGEKPGWSVDPDKRCDYVAYSIPLAERCYFLPLELVRQAWRADHLRWKERPGAYPKDAKNVGYITRNVAVNWADLRASLCRQMLRQFGQSLEMPNANKLLDGQLGFFWTREDE